VGVEYQPVLAMPKTPDPVELLIVPLSLTGVSIICKYIIKLPELTQQNGFPRSTHFEVLRFGTDLSVTAIIAAISVLAFAGSPVGSLSQADAPKRVALWFVNNPSLTTTFQLSLLLLTLLASALLRSPDRDFYKGTIIPGVLGFLAMALSLEMFCAF
jgi:hypothetical protein